jgi:hypothetical protein
MGHTTLSVHNCKKNNLYIEEIEGLLIRILKRFELIYI